MYLFMMIRIKVLSMKYTIIPVHEPKHNQHHENNSTLSTKEKSPTNFPKSQPIKLLIHVVLRGGVKCFGY